MLPATETWLDTNDEPMAVDGNASRHNTYDPTGALSSMTYFDVDGEPTRGRATAYVGGFFIRCHRVEIPRNAKGESLGLICLDAQGKRQMTERGYAARVFTRTPLGKVAETRFEDAEGNPVTNVLGFARHVHEFNAQGKVTVHSSFDADGLPTTSKSDGCATRIESFDDYGKTVSACCFDPEGEPTPNTQSGTACLTAEHDAYGRLTQEALFDGHDNPVLGLDGFAMATFEYPSKDPLDYTLRYYGTEGEPVPNNVEGDEYWGLHLIFGEEDDEYAQLIEVLGPDGELMDTPLSCARKESTVDHRGRIVAVVQTDASGAPCAPLVELGGEERWSSSNRRVWDAQGRLLKQEFFGVDGQPVLEEGVAAVIHRYDERGNRISSKQLGIDGLPVARNGCAEVQRAFDAHRRVKEKACFGPDGAPTGDPKGVARWRYHYASRPLAIVEEAFGPEGAPIETIEGWHRLERELNSLGTTAREAWFDKEGRPVNGPGGCPVNVMTTNADGWVIEQSCGS